MRDLVEAVLRGQLPAVCLSAEGGPSSGRPRALLPGSFNPLHEGHRELARVAVEWVGGPAAFELTARNADKPPLDVEEVLRRALAFRGWADLWVTAAPTFPQKAHLFPDTVFVVGADTAERIVQPRFYDGTAEGTRRALDEVRRCGCRFLVAGRLGPGGFVRLAELDVPPYLAGLFEELPEEQFRRDVSSTQLRSRAVEY